MSARTAKDRPRGAVSATDRRGGNREAVRELLPVLDACVAAA